MMDKNVELFNKDESGEPIEGYLGDSNDCKILFIMREPNSGGEKADTFWFKQVIDETLDPNAKGYSTSKRQGTRFFNIFKKLATIILKEEDIEGDTREFFKKCCYINMLDAGEKTVSVNYKELQKEMKDSGSENKILIKRREVIKKLIEIGYKHIITTHEIFEWLCENNPHEEGIKYGENKIFRMCKCYGAKVYEFYHPSYTRIKYDQITDL